jgi:hypothetical protein
MSPPKEDRGGVRHLGFDQGRSARQVGRRFGVRPPAGYLRAAGHLSDIQQLAAAVRRFPGENGPAISVLLIDSNLWVCAPSVVSIGIDTSS